MNYSHAMQKKTLGFWDIADILFSTNPIHDIQEPRAPDEQWAAKAQVRPGEVVIAMGGYENP
jgi:hypothetical protein